MEEQSIKTISLHRGTNGLGFNIRGGNDQPHLPNDTGIFVTKIRESGAAAQDGTLQEGDKILEINGNTMEDINHNDAVNLFLSAGDEVKLKIWSGAESILMSNYARDVDEYGSTLGGKNLAVLLAGAAIVFCVIYYRKNILDGLKKLAEKAGLGSSV